MSTPCQLSLRSLGWREGWKRGQEGKGREEKGGWNGRKRDAGLGCGFGFKERLADRCVKRYCAGHLIEAALAHSKYYKNDLLIEPIEKYVKLIATVFGPGPDQVSNSFSLTF